MSFLIGSNVFISPRVYAIVRENERKGRVHRQGSAAGVLAFCCQDFFEKNFERDTLLCA